jgi:hypothetical protein
MVRSSVRGRQGYYQFADRWTAIRQSITEEYGSGVELEYHERNTLCERKEDVYIASALIVMNELQLIRGLFTVFSEQEITTTAAIYLKKGRTARFVDGEWAWVALAWGEMSNDTRFQMTIELVDLLNTATIGEEHTAVALIADILIGELQSDNAVIARLTELSNVNANIAVLLVWRVREHAEWKQRKGIRTDNGK